MPISRRVIYLIGSRKSDCCASLMPSTARLCSDASIGQRGLELFSVEQVHAHVSEPIRAGCVCKVC